MTQLIRGLQTHRPYLQTPAEADGPALALVRGRQRRLSARLPGAAREAAAIASLMPRTALTGSTALQRIVSASWHLRWIDTG